MQTDDHERQVGMKVAADDGVAGVAARGAVEPRTLYVVATPLGNLGDVTLRAVETLRRVDVLAAEDTRVTAVLLRHLGIERRMLSLHQHNEARRSEQVVAELAAGRSVALVSDAGTPAISDPGAKLVRAVRAAGFAVVPVPGANAAAAALSAAGLVAERFTFLGFLPASAKARRELLAVYAALPCALVVYEAPHRVCATVDAMVEILGGERELVIARELTKKFETMAAMPLAEAPAWLDADTNRVRGEFVLLVDAPKRAEHAPEVIGLSADVERWLAALVPELSPARAARVIASVTGVPREVVYARAVALAKGTEQSE